MLVFKEEHIHLDRKNAEHMLFEFDVKSTYEETVLIKAKAACGCSGVNSDFKVEPGQEFKLVGFLNKRGSLGKHTKNITVRAFTDRLLRNKQLELKKIKFTINVQDPNIDIKP